MNGIKFVVFDLWDTLACGEPSNFHKALQKKIHAESEERVLKALNSTIFVKKYNSIETGFCDFCMHAGVSLTKENIEKCMGMWDKNKIELTPNAEAVLDYLSGKYKIGLLSTTDAFSANLVFEKFGIRRFFSFVSLSCNSGFLKPDRNAFLSILNDSGFSPEESVMIGDSIRRDIAGAKNAGMRAILFNTRNIDNIAMTDYVTKNMCEIPRIIKGM